MKKYFFGLVAIAFAAGLTAFTNINPRPFTDVDLYLDGNPNSQSVVGTESNWKATPTITCDAVDDKACKIRVNLNFTTLNGSGVRILDGSDVFIDGVQGDEAGFYIPEVNASSPNPVVSIVNKN